MRLAIVSRSSLSRLIRSSMVKTLSRIEKLSRLPGSVIVVFEQTIHELLRIEEEQIVNRFPHADVMDR